MTTYGNLICAHCGEEFLAAYHNPPPAKPLCRECFGSWCESCNEPLAKSEVVHDECGDDLCAPCAARVTPAEGASPVRLGCE